MEQFRPGVSYYFYCLRLQFVRLAVVQLVLAGLLVVFYSTSYKTSIKERGGAPSGKDDELLFLLVLSPSTFRNVWTFSNSRIGAFSCSYSDQFCLNIFQQAFGSSLSNKQSVFSPVACGYKFLLVANCNTAISGLLLGLIERER